MDDAKENKTLDYWRMVNASTSEFENVTAMGGWTEADKLTEVDD